MLTLKARGSEWTPARDTYNGLANSLFHRLVFGSISANIAQPEFQPLITPMYARHER